MKAVKSGLARRAANRSIVLREYARLEGWVVRLMSILLHDSSSYPPAEPQDHTENQAQ